MSTCHIHIEKPLLEKEMAANSSVLAWRISGSEEPGGPVYGVALSQDMTGVT